MKITVLMRAAVSSSADFSRAVADAMRAGFDGIELIAHARLMQADAAVWAEMRSLAQRESVRRISLGWPTADGLRLAAGEPSDRVEARRRLSAAIDRAAWLGAGTLSFSPAGGARDRQSLRYEDAYHSALDALAAARFEAQTRGVRLGCAVGADGFLLTPIEARQFTDAVNSPWVGAWVDILQVARFAAPDDWIRTLSHRVAGISIGCGIESARPDWGSIGASMEEVGFGGPIAAYGGDDAAKIYASLCKALGR